MYLALTSPVRYPNALNSRFRFAGDFLTLPVKILYNHVSGCNTAIVSNLISSRMFIVKEKILQILLVEDNPGDVYLFKAALAESSAAVELEVFDNGLVAWNHLERIAVEKSPTPDLIVLDLNLPGMNGRQILSEMATRPELHKIPICVFTGAGSEESIVDEHAPLRLCFFAKVDNFTKLREIVSSFLNFAGASPSV